MTPKIKSQKSKRKLRPCSSGQLLSDIYRHTLANLLSEISFEKQLNFGHQLLQRNYRFILVNLLAKEAQREYAVKELERILEEWNKIAEEKDFEFLECLLTVLRERASDFASEPAYERLRTSLLRLVEDYILRGETDPQLDDFIDKLGASVYEPRVYLETIFKEKRVTVLLIKAYFVFFPVASPIF